MNKLANEPSLLPRQTGGLEFVAWLRQLGKSRTTGYRWRMKGMVKTVNVEGIHYISWAEIERFWRRASAGEFRRQRGHPLNKA